MPPATPKKKTPDTPEIAALKERAKDVSKQFRRDGISVASWAAARNLSTPLIYEVLKGKRSCLRGESHRAAVLLGIKPGDPSANAKNYDPRLAAAN